MSNRIVIRGCKHQVVPLNGSNDDESWMNGLAYFQTSKSQESRNKW